MYIDAPQRARSDGALGRLARRRARPGAAAGAALALGVVALLASACSGSNAPDAKAAPGLITTSYSSFFNLASKNVPEKLAHIQDGQALKAGVTAAVNSSLAASATGSKIDKVTLLSNSACQAVPVPAPCAKVTYDILGMNGAALLSGETGYAIYENGQWLVAKTTICSLLDLFYEAEGKSGSSPGC